MVSKNQQKIVETNSMPNLPIGNTQVTLNENVGSLVAPRASQLFTFWPYMQGAALRGS